MMALPPPAPSLSSPPPALSSLPAAFSFNAPAIVRSWTPLPIERLPTSMPVHSRGCKRPRAITDLDGDDRIIGPVSKKRRLRLHLITSRLSQPFAEPCTYINSRGAYIAARLAFQRRIGRSLLRKAAIANWMRIRRGVLPAVTSKAVVETSPDLEVAPEEEFALTMPAPLMEQWTASGSEALPGLSNYHAIDLEDGPFDDGGWSDTVEEMDLDIRARKAPEEVMPEVLGAMRGVSPRPWVSGDIHRPNPYWAVLAEEERQKEVSVATFSKRSLLY